jgi:hypothetical protein
MPIARFEMPDGRVARFEVPEGTSPEKAEQLFQDAFLAHNLQALTSKVAPGDRAQYTVQAIDGKTYTIEGPAGASKEQLVRAILAQNPGAGLPPSLAPIPAGDAAVQKQQPTVQSSSAQMVVAEPPTPPASKPVDAAFVAIFFAVVAALLICEMLLARALNRRHLGRHPQCKPFAWGYFSALSSATTPLFFALGVSTNRDLDVTSQGVLLAIFLLLFLPPVVLTLRRSRVGFIWLTALTLNPLLWIINGIYLKNRWTEMAGGHPPANVNNDHFGKALLELDNGTRDNGLWAKCFAEAQGNESAAKAAYIKQRATELANPH